MTDGTSGAAPTRREFLLLAGSLVLAASSQSLGRAETPIHTVYLAPVAAGTAEAIRKSLARKLAASGLVRLVGEQTGADSVLRIATVLWPAGTIAVNPRSPSNSYTTYQGYASAELADSTSATLWSYLATPSRFRLGGLVDDLASQLSASLLAALRNGSTNSVAPSASTGTVAPSGASLRAAGATFPAPLYRKWFESFAQRPGGFPIRYDAIGSVAGRQQLAEERVDLAASDIPAAAGDAEPGLLRVPTVLGGIVPIYNLAAAAHGLRLTAEVLAGIYAGQIRRWNDPRLKELNKGLHLPDAEIAVVHRSDGSGTSYVWTHFLGMAPSSAWTLGAQASPAWPVGTGAAGNQGVAEMVTHTPNSIGYVELTYAIQQQLPTAAVRNPSGAFVHADLASLAAAAESAQAVGRDQGLAMLNAPGKEAYPVTSYTWLLARRDTADTARREQITSFLRWMLSEGQKQCAGLGYAPLPRDLAASELRSLDAWR